VTPEAARVRRYSPDRVRTRANAVTVARMVLSVPLLVAMAASGSSWALLAGWVVLGITDGVDGWLARRDGTTRSGAFLDPLADKFYSAGGFVALAVHGTYGWLPVGLIVGREVGISFYRSWVARRGISLPANMLGKVKTNVQIVIVGFGLLPSLDDADGFHALGLWVATTITVVSGLQIVFHGTRGALAR
jgi:CDP-diacylglycerol---glycerol-3-phosphate 3-phosphatidyltransferase